MIANIEQIILVSLLGIAAGTIAYTITKGSIFNQVRVHLAGLPVIGSLVTCPYCCAHWTALALTILVPIGLAAKCTEVQAAVFLVDWFVTVFVAAMTIGALLRAFTLVIYDQVEDQNS